MEIKKQLLREYQIKQQNLKASKIDIKLKKLLSKPINKKLMKITLKYWKTLADLKKEKNPKIKKILESNRKVYQQYFIKRLPRERRISKKTQPRLTNLYKKNSRKHVLREIVSSQVPLILSWKSYDSNDNLKPDLFQLTIKFSQNVKTMNKFNFRGHIFTKLEIIKGIKAYIIHLKKLKDNFDLNDFNFEARLSAGFNKGRTSSGKLTHTLITVKDLDELHENYNGEISAPFWEIPKIKGKPYSEEEESQEMLAPNLQYVSFMFTEDLKGSGLSKFNDLTQVARKFTKEDYKENKIFIKNPKRIQRFMVKDGIVLTKDTKNDDNECFFKALSLSSNQNCRFDKLRAADFKIIREACGIEKNTKLSFAQINTLAEYLKINLKIYSNDKILIQDISGNKLSIEIYTLYYHQNHYFYYFETDNTVKTKNYFEQPCKIFYPVFIDFETIVNKCGLLNTYSVSILPWKQKKAKFFISEPNTDNIMTLLTDYLIQLFNHINKSSESKFKYSMFNSYNNNEEYIKNYLKKNKIKLMLVGHNAAKFDYMLYADYLTRKHRYRVDITFGTNEIRNLKTFFIAGAFDSIKLLSCSLKKACKDFKIKNELSKNSGKEEDFNHNDIQLLYDEEGIEAVINKMGKDIEEYNNLDVVSLRAIMVKMIKENKTISEACGIRHSPCDIFLAKTIGSLTKKKCNELGENNGVYQPGTVLTYKTFEIYRKALIGGRTQIYKKNYKPGDIKENMVSMDATSLYPTVMTKDYFYPCGKCIETSKYIEGPLGIYRCTNINQSSLKFPIIPIKSEDILNWNNTKLIKEQYLTTIDMSELKKYGCTFTINEGIYWTEKDNKYFGEYIKILYKLKQDQDLLKYKKAIEYNPALRQYDKILMNSLYGKNMENIHKEFKELVSNISKIPDIAKKCNIDTKINLRDSKFLLEGKIKERYIHENWEKEYKRKHSLAGVFILSYSRAYMYKFIKLFEDCVVYQDTDSLHIPKERFNKFKKEYPEFIPKNGIKQLGDFEDEFEDYKELIKENKCIYFAKKLYAICDVNLNPIKYKAKGVSINNNTYFYRNIDKIYIDKNFINEPYEYELKYIKIIGNERRYITDEEALNCDLDIYPWKYKTEKKSAMFRKIFKEKINNKEVKYYIKSGLKLLAKDNIKEFFLKFKEEKTIDVYTRLLKRFTTINVYDNIAMCKIAQYEMKKTIKY